MAPAVLSRFLVVAEKQGTVVFRSLSTTAARCKKEAATPPPSKERFLPQKESLTFPKGFVASVSARYFAFFILLLRANDGKRECMLG
jgi:hypothetical protein